jgi:hypothetical protein
MHDWLPGSGLTGALVGAGVSAAFGLSAGFFFVALTLLLVAGWWGSRVLRQPPARPPRPFFALLLEHPG